MNYATLHQVRQYLGLKTAETADDARLTRFIRESCQGIDEYCGRRFDVRQETRLLDYPIPVKSTFGHYSAEDFASWMNATADLGQGRLAVDDDLLAVTALLNGNGEAITAADYVLEPANVYPKHTIRLKSGSSLYWQPATDGTREQVISVSGLWGYHPRYADAWVDSLDTVNDAPLAAAATTVNVNDADGPAGDGETIRFQAGNLLRLESEFLDVVAVDTTLNRLTVKRGANGTTAAQHAAGTAIYVYRPLENVVLAAIRLTAWRYRQKDVDAFDKTAILGTGFAIIPAAIPADVKALLPAPKVTLR